MRPEAGAGDASALLEAPDDLPEGGGDYLVAGRVGVAVRPDRRRSAHPGPLTDPGDVERHGAHAWERGGVGEVRLAEGGLHVVSGDRNAEGPEAGVEQRVEVTSRLTLQGLPALPLTPSARDPARSAGGSSRSDRPRPAGPVPLRGGVRGGPGKVQPCRTRPDGSGTPRFARRPLASRRACGRYIRRRPR